jgi:hypothetical protein
MCSGLAGGPVVAYGDPGPSEQLARLAGDFGATTPQDFARQLDLGQQAMRLGEPGLQLVADWMFAPQYEARFRSPFMRRQFNKRVALDLAQIPSPGAREALRRFYLQGSRRGKLERRGPYDIRFDWQQPLVTTTDEEGERWAVVALWWYGSHEDLWIIHSTDGETWSYPLFTGLGRLARGDSRYQMRLEVRAGKVRILYPRHDVPPNASRVARAEEEISIADLTRDSDRDGLYDVEERRLRTDPRKPDTDGDGLVDGEDLNPLVGRNPRQLTDEQAIRQAVFRRHVHDEVKLTVIQAEPADRQEYLGGFGGITLSLSKQEIAEFRKEAGGGVPTFSFGEIRFSQEGNYAELEFTDYAAPRARAVFLVKLRKVLPGLWAVTDDNCIAKS